MAPAPHRRWWASVALVAAVATQHSVTGFVLQPGCPLRIGSGQAAGNRGSPVCASGGGRRSLCSTRSRSALHMSERNTEDRQAPLPFQRIMQRFKVLVLSYIPHTLMCVS